MDDNSQVSYLTILDVTRLSESLSSETLTITFLVDYILGPFFESRGNYVGGKGKKSDR